MDGTTLFFTITGVAFWSYAFVEFIDRLDKGKIPPKRPAKRRRIAQRILRG